MASSFLTQPPWTQLKRLCRVLSVACIGWACSGDRIPGTPPQAPTNSAGAEGPHVEERLAGGVPEGLLSAYGLEPVAAPTTSWQVGEIVAVGRTDGRLVRADRVCAPSSVVAGFDDFHFGRGGTTQDDRATHVKAEIEARLGRVLSASASGESAYKTQVRIEDLEIAEWALEDRRAAAVGRRCHEVLTPTPRGAALVSRLLTATVGVLVERKSGAELEVATAKALGDIFNIGAEASASLVREGRFEYTAEGLVFGVSLDEEAPQAYGNKDPRGDRRVELVVWPPDDEIVCDLDGTRLIARRHPNQSKEPGKHGPKTVDITRRVVEGRQHVLHCVVRDRDTTKGYSYSWRFMVRRTDTGEVFVDEEFACPYWTDECNTGTEIVLDREFTFND